MEKASVVFANTFEDENAIKVTADPNEMTLTFKSKKGYIADFWVGKDLPESARIECWNRVADTIITLGQKMKITT